MWDPGQYQRYAGERARPFFDLVGRVGAESPVAVVDLGCGPGNLTAALAQRWPSADVLGVDNSAEMLAAARGEAAREPRLRFTGGDIATWAPPSPVDVIVSNAALQWVPDHQEVLRRWPGYLAPGGWIAVQVPGNNGSPSHVAAAELAATDRWRARLAGVRLNTQAADAASYLALLAGEGCEVDAWETTYLHVLTGEDPVTQWYRGTGLRPVLAALDGADAAEFLASYGERVREAYPAGPHGTVFPFRRVFVVARRS